MSEFRESRDRLSSRGPMTLRRRVLALSATLLLAARLATAYDITNTAYVSYQNDAGGAQPPARSSTTFAVPLAPLVTAFKAATATDLVDGQAAVFTLTLINVGNDTAFNVEVLDTLPAPVGYAAGSAVPAPDPGWGPRPGPPQVLRWTVGPVPVGGSWSVTLSGIALPPGTAPAAVSNVGRVHYRSQGGGLSAIADTAPLAMIVRPSLTPTGGCPPNCPPATVRLTVNVYDATGRLVRTLRNVMVLSSVTLVSAGDGRGAATITANAGMPVELSDGTLLRWDGKDASGATVPNGAYTVRVSDRLPDGRMETSAATVAVTQPYTRVIGSAVLVPNPANDVAWIGFTLAVTDATVKIRIYDVLGALVFADAVPGTARSYRWDLRNREGVRVGAGAYLLVLEAADPVTGRSDRRAMKLAVAPEVP